MSSRTLANPVEETVPPLPATLKKSASLNSQASVVCATKTMSRERYSRRSPTATQKKNVFANCRSRSVMLPDTSSRKNTAARIAGWRLRVSCRKRKSSSVNDGDEESTAALRLIDSLKERRRWRRDRTAPIQALAFPVRLLRRSHTRLQIGKLHVFPQPIDDVVDLEFEQQFRAAALFAPGALLPRAALGGTLTERVARFGF